MESVTLVRTFGEVFPKCMIELVADDEAEGSLGLLIWNGVESHIQARVRLALGPGSNRNVKLFEPPDFDSTILRAMRFPTCVSAYGSCRELFDNICKVVEEVTELAPESVRWWPIPSSRVGFRIALLSPFFFRLLVRDRLTGSICFAY